MFNRQRDGLSTLQTAANQFQLGDTDVAQATANNANTELQTVYLVTPEGNISTQSRDTSAEVERRPVPATRKVLERGRFADLWSARDGGAVRLTSSELTLFIEGCALVGQKTLSPPAIMRNELAASDRV